MCGRCRDKNPCIFHVGATGLLQGRTQQPAAEAGGGGGADGVVEID
jgi:hypothetical protein